MQGRRLIRFLYITMVILISGCHLISFGQNPINRNGETKGFVESSHSPFRITNNPDKDSRSNSDNPYPDYSVQTDSTWPKIFHSECDCPMANICLAYDQGNLLLGWFGSSYPSSCWLIKTDINGNKLWEKILSGGNFSKAVFGLCQNQQGDIFITGTSYQYGDSDPYIVKINSCGQKEWCKIFRTPNIYDCATNVLPNQDGGCRLILDYSSGDPLYQHGRICQTDLDSDGHELWRYYYESSDTLVSNEQDRQILSTADSGMLISGDCYYQDTSFNNLLYLKCYYIKTNNSGAFEWKTVSEKDFSLPGKPGGQAWTTLINEQNDFYYSSISHYLASNNTSSPALLKMDISGNVIGIYDLVQGYTEGKLFESAWVNNSTLIGSAAWFNGSGSPQESKAVKIDTLGNIIQTRTLLMGEYLSYVRKTLDNKFIFYTMRNNSTNVNIPHFNSYLFKLNQFLDFDSINSLPIIYDFNCSGVISTDTIIVNNCDLILNIEKPEINTDDFEVLIYPNPTGQLANIRLPKFLTSTTRMGNFSSTFQNFNYKQGSVINIFDQAGKLVYQRKLSTSDMVVTVNVSHFSPGIYLVNIEGPYKTKVFKSTKFIIAR